MERLGPSLTTRLRPADNAYLRKLAARTRIKPAWYLRHAFEEWLERHREELWDMKEHPDEPLPVHQ